jgi:sugar phosphate isomerase/epimerase
MGLADQSFYIGTILLERNRHRAGRMPSYRVSEWVARFRQAGFAGMELWENHARLADPAEQAAIVAGGFLISVFNAYCEFSDAPAAATGRAQSAALVRETKAPAVKYNVGGDPALEPTYLRNVAAWADALPPRTRLLCECHAGTIAETPAAAKRLLDALAAARPAAHFGAIVHMPADARIAEWFDALGERVEHLHVVLKPPAEDPGDATLRERTRVLRDRGFDGSFTLEFTEGMNAPDEQIDVMWQRALRDLGRLRAAL